MAQTACSLAAVLLILTSFRTVSGFTLSATLGSHATLFAMLSAYSAVLYSLYVLLAVEYFKYAPRLAPKVDSAVDALFVIVLLVAGVVLIRSDVVSHCDEYAYAVNCDRLFLGMVFTFATGVAFVFTWVRPAPTSESYGVKKEH
ncbi:hypothetical protein Poli38472_001242 [Pythium oligandrum]|uniref:MARVEL domain-containing protein n=1 Tax=Pythium oligandrum TaxID=41045 RepID=A0A8K1CUW9_PYTOL|nr:hypothetical protein Poli38472_001242 [Pythium oligandrum]|eukprot:TMW69086.1 hypothetical protein Poli38472_001242 [Pythium oligandrum]